MKKAVGATLDQTAREEVLQQDIRKGKLVVKTLESSRQQAPRTRFAQYLIPCKLTPSGPPASLNLPAGKCAERGFFLGSQNRELAGSARGLKQDTVYYSPFTILYLLFTIHYLLFTIHHSPFTIH